LGLAPVCVCVYECVRVLVHVTTQKAAKLICYGGAHTHGERRVLCTRVGACGGTEDAKQICYGGAHTHGERRVLCTRVWCM
jgi:hypothetical protein